MNRITSNIVGQGKPSLSLPYRSGNDRGLTVPLAPRSQEVTSPYANGKIDIRWDDPSLYVDNSGYAFMGVNIYRCFDSPYGTYVRINNIPAQSHTYRDTTTENFVLHEDAMPRLDPGNNPNGEWRFFVLNKPMVISGGTGAYACNYSHLKVEVDTGNGIWVEVPAFKVDGRNGYVVLNSNRVYLPETNTFSDPLLPNLETGGIRVSYTYMDKLLDTGLYRNIYYKVATVVRDSEGNFLETPLDEIEARSLLDMENIDFTWKEAIRRNHWILDQGGENVKLFLRKWAGVPCQCTSEEYGRSKRTGIGNNQCLVCFGTGYVGGYEGPYDAVVEPPNTEKTVQLGETGLRIQYDWTSWMGPEPLVKDRDVLVRANNDRFLFSNVNPIGSRGAIYQQSFSLSQLSARDPIYSIPIVGGHDLTPEGWDAYREGRASSAQPIMAEKPGLPPDQRIISRTVTFENITG